MEPIDKADHDAVDPAALMTIDEFEAVARKTLEPSVYDYVAGGAGNEDSVEHNRRALGRWRIRPRMLVDLSHLDPSISLLGDDLASPLLLAPSALHRLAHPDGELATAHAAKRAGVGMILSMNASTALEDVAAVGATTWFQLYLYRDRQVTIDLLARAEAAGCRAICLTVEHPGMPWRVRELRQPLRIPPGAEFVHLPPERRGPEDLEPNLTWDLVEWLRDATSLRIALKGILDPEDARLAAELGVDAIVVSNHGGRQMSGSVAAWDVLPQVAAAVDGRCSLLADGGVRTGVDVFRAIALGADAVLIGRPVVWGLAAAGEAGVAQIIRLLHDEFVSILGSTGCPTPDRIHPGMLVDIGT